MRRAGAAAIALQADRRAITALEYAMLAMFVALALVGAEIQFGHDVQALFRNDTAPIAAVANGIGSSSAPSGGGSS